MILVEERGLGQRLGRRPRPGLMLGLGLMLALGSSGCSEGAGEGEFVGVVSAPACGLHGEAFDLQPDFFAADPLGDSLSVRIQRGSNHEDLSDGIRIGVRSSSEVAEMLGTPLPLIDPSTVPLSAPLAEQPLVRGSFFLNETCPIDRGVFPVRYVAVSGTVTFDAIYVPSMDDSELRIEGTLEEAHFVD
ncbi:MAG: hypothetical protein OEY14_00685, partial [Myxococcales bacterium]|nr:hypothetical protein [Myxococcales bacterium]